METLKDMTPADGSDDSKGSLQERAVLVRLERKNVWLGKRTDKDISAAIQTSKGLTKSHGDYKRHLFPDCDQPLEQALNAINHVDYVYRRRTLPWLPGVNIIATPLFLTFTEAMNEALTALDRSRIELTNQWPAMVAAGIANSKGTASLDEYPQVADLDEMYRMELTYYPVPDSGDWRVTLPADVVQNIKDRLQEDNEKRLAQTTIEIWKRLTAEIEAAWKNLDGKKLRPEWLARIKELAQSIPDLNLADDPDLNAAAKKAEELTQHDIETLKGDPDLRKETAEKAEALYDNLKDLF
ncbi:MAG: hypothetical protein GY906_24575 [bacterium]|nr:hypothetical protein [bacterium]